MEFWGVVLKAVVSLIVYCWDEILFGLIEWAWHKLKDGKDPKPEQPN